MWATLVRVTVRRLDPRRRPGPRRPALNLDSTAIGDAGLVALAPALRRRPALESLNLACNLFGDKGLAALVAPPSPAGAPPPPAGVLTKLRRLVLSDTQVTDAGCAALAAAMAARCRRSPLSVCLASLPAPRRRPPHMTHWQGRDPPCAPDPITCFLHLGQPRAGAFPFHECKRTTACSIVLSALSLA